MGSGGYREKTMGAGVLSGAHVLSESQGRERLLLAAPDP